MLNSWRDNHLNVKLVPISHGELLVSSLTHASTHLRFTMMITHTKDVCQTTNLGSSQVTTYESTYSRPRTLSL